MKNQILCSPISQSDKYNAEDITINFLSKLNALSNYELFGIREKCLRNLSIFAGSFGFHLKFDGIKKDIMNDIDILFPSSHKDFLKNYFKTNNIEYKQIGNIITSYIKHEPVYVKYDFILKQFLSDKVPSEVSQFCNSYHFDDEKLGLKGGFHKIMLSSLTAAFDEKYVFSTSYGLRTRDEKMYMGEMFSLEETYLGLFYGITEVKNEECLEHVSHAFQMDEYFYSFQGLCILMDWIFSKEQKEKVLNKFHHKLNEKKYSEKQLNIINDVIKMELN